MTSADLSRLPSQLAEAVAGIEEALQGVEAKSHEARHLRNLRSALLPLAGRLAVAVAKADPTPAAFATSAAMVVIISMIVTIRATTIRLARTGDRRRSAGIRRVMLRSRPRLRGIPARPPTFGLHPRVGGPEDGRHHPAQMLGSGRRGSGQRPAVRSTR